MANSGVDMTGVTNSSSASEKSVVMLGWVSAEPKALGCAHCESSPAGVVRKPSFSIPRWMPVNVPTVPDCSRRSRLF